MLRTPRVLIIRSIIGEVIRVSTNSFQILPNGDRVPYNNITFRIDEVIYGLVEYVAEGREIRMNTRHRELDEFREFMTPLMFRHVVEGLGSVPLELEIQDEDFILVLEATGNVLLLLEMLYPVFVGLAALIAVALAVLMVLQGMRTTFCLRILGASKWQTLLVLCGEYALVCVMGILIGAVVLMAMFGANAVSLGVIGLYLGGTLVGAVATALNIIRRNPLKLLQLGGRE
jgi:hypothetical protein